MNRKLGSSSCAKYENFISIFTDRHFKHHLHEIVKIYLDIRYPWTIFIVRLRRCTNERVGTFLVRVHTQSERQIDLVLERIHENTCKFRLIAQQIDRLPYTRASL